MEAKSQLLPAPPNKARQHFPAYKKYQSAIRRDSLPEAQTVSSRKFKAGVKLGLELLTFKELFSSHLAQGKEKNQLVNEHIILHFNSWMWPDICTGNDWINAG